MRQQWQLSQKSLLAFRKSATTVWNGFLCPDVPSTSVCSWRAQHKAAGASHWTRGAALLARLTNTLFYAISEFFCFLQVPFFQWGWTMLTPPSLSNLAPRFRHCHFYAVLIAFAPCSSFLLTLSDYALCACFFVCLQALLSCSLRYLTSLRAFVGCGSLPWSLLLLSAFAFHFRSLPSLFAQAFFFAQGCKKTVFVKQTIVRF